MALTHDDLPALYRDADAASIKAQQAFIRALGASLSLLVVAAILTVWNYPSQAFAFFQAVVLLISLGLTLYLAFRQPQKAWYGTRALAESIKTVAWRYSMRAEPYGIPDGEARDRFVDNVQKIRGDNDASKHALVITHGDQITPAMSSMRKLSLAERREAYDKGRVQDQLGWYKKKATLNDRRSKQWFACVVGMHAFALACVLGRIAKPEFVWLPTDVFLAGAAAAVAWMQMKRFQELAASYTLTAHDIGLFKTKIAYLRTEKEFSDFVGDAENAFSREHTQWRARRDVE